MKPSSFLKSVFSLAMLAGFTASSHALTFDYETHGGAVETDVQLNFDAINTMYYVPNPPGNLPCDALNLDGTCDHGSGNLSNLSLK